MAMTRDQKRQATLLAALCLVLVGYLYYGGYVSFGGGDVDTEALPPIDAASLERSLKSISTVDPGLILAEKGDSVPDRNLFQYGVRKPPPPDPAELERQRQAAQAALAAQEAALRAQKAREQQQLQAPPPVVQPEPVKVADNRPPPPPPKPVAPAITFRLMGVFGPPKEMIGVFMEGSNPPLLAKRGEVVREKFRVLEVGVEWADIGYVDPQFQNEKKRIYLGS